ncbi:MAG: DUF4386 domain-containing protein [Nitrososphaeraceae archaeon]
MNSNRKTAIVAGILFIFATVVNLLSNVAFLKPILDAPDYLSRIFASENQILIGSLLHIIASFACAGIAIALYPVLRKYNEGLALGSVGFRIAEGMLYVFGSIGVLMLLPLSQEFIKAGMPGASYFQTLANSLLSMRDWTGILVVITFGAGALMYYAIFYKSKLIPRWLSGWGFIAAALCLISGILVMFNIIEFFTPVQIAINIPIALQEIVLAIWLIVKGFNLPAASTGSAKQI